MRIEFGMDTGTVQLILDHETGTPALLLRTKRPADRQEIVPMFGHKPGPGDVLVVAMTPHGAAVVSEFASKLAEASLAQQGRFPTEALFDIRA